MNTMTKHPLNATPIPSENMLGKHSFEASSLLKALGHQGRLMLLSHLSEGEKTVMDLQKLTNASQALVSCHLARLRHEGLVEFRKNGKNCIYSLKDEKVRHVLKVVNDVFCSGLGAMIDDGDNHGDDDNQDNQ